MTRVLRQGTWLLALVATLLLSCDQPPQTDPYSLNQEQVADEALRELSARQFLTYRIGTGNPVSVSLVQGAGASLPSALTTAIGNECRLRMWRARNGILPSDTTVPPSDVYDPYYLAGTSYCTNPSITGTVATYYCMVQGSSCELQLMMEIAESTGNTTLSYYWGATERGDMVVDVLGSAERAAMVEIAVATYSGNVQWFAGTLSAANMQACTNCTTAFNTTPTATTTLAEAVPASLGIFYDGLRSAVRTLRDRYVALADEAAAGTADRTEAGDRAMAIRALGASLVRGYWAGIGVGGRPPTPAVMMLAPPLSNRQSVKRARDLILETALPPSQIFALENNARNTSVGFIAAGYSDTTVLATILSRYNTLHSSTLATSTDLFNRVGTDLVAFTRARSELADRFFLFRRSVIQALPDRTNPTITGLYAASATEASIGDADWPIFGGILQRRTSYTLGLGHAASALVTAYRGYVNQASPTAAVTTAKAQYKAIRDLAYADSPGNITLTFASPSVNVDFYYEGRANANDVLIIANANPNIAADVLRCATQGTIEGQPCTSTDLTGYAASAMGTYDGEGRRLFQKTMLPAGAAIYVVVRREDSPVDTGTLRPGNFIAVFSGMTPTATGGINQGTYRIVPDTEEMAGRMMIPSWDSPQPEISCANIDSGETPLVLESTATSTQNGEEDSWRQYLTLARQAADEADLLGEQAMNAEMEASSQAEGALQELQQLCGVSADLDTIRAAVLTGTDPVLSLGSGSLSTTDDPDMRRLRACVTTDASSVQPQLSLGSEKICVWTLNGNAERLCERAPGETNTDLPCPRLWDPALDTVAGNDGGCRVPTQSNANYTAVSLDEQRELLAYVTPLSDASKTPTATNTVETASCNGLRQFLASMDSWANANGTPSTTIESQFANYVRAARYLDPNRAAELARGIRWEAVVGGYSKLYVNDRLLFTTGSLVGGPTVGGLCAGGANAVIPTATECPSGSNTLLCRATQQVDCTNVDGRAALNNRMLGAAMIARWLGGQQLQDFVVPRIVEPHQQSAAWNAYSVGSATFMYTSDGTTTRWCQVPDAGVQQSLWDWGTYTSGGELFRSSCSIGTGTWGSRDFVLQTLTASDAVDVGHNLGNMWADSETQGALTFLRGLTAGTTGVSGLSNTLFAGAATDPTSTSALYTFPDGFDGGYSGGRGFFGFYFKNSDNKTLTLTNSSSPSGAYYEILHGPQGGRQVTGLPVHDAIELLCEADRSVGTAQPSCGGTPTGLDASNLDVAANQIQCVADTVRRRASLSVFTNVPRAAVDAMRQDDPLGTQTQVGGDFAQAVVRMRIAMQNISRANEEISSHASAFSRTVRDTQRQLRILQLQQDNQRLSLMSNIVNQMSGCASQMASAWKVTNIASSAIACSNAVAQVGFASAQYRNEKKINEQEEGRIFIALEQAAADRGEGMAAASAEILRNQEELDAAAHQIVQIRSRGQQLLRSALYVSGSNIAPVMATQVASRQRLNTANVRYRRAFRNAVRLSDLARRAIEQRFAVRLSDITQDLQFVEAPALWSSRLCAMTGIDYSRIVAAGQSDVNADYADEYIGDYVRNLEQFVLSYGFAYPNTSGKDTAVVSLRDDVLRVRDRCEVSLNNAIARSNDLTAAPDGTIGGWQPFGCVADGLATETSPYTNCVLVDRIAETWPAFDIAGIGIPVPFRVTFGASATGVCANAQCSWQTGATLGQTIAMSAGTYRVSWYGRAVSGSTTSPSRAVRVVNANTPSTVLLQSAAPSSAALGTWTRYWYTGTIGSETDARVEIQNYGGSFNHKVDIAGLMIERINGTASTDPPQFIETSSAGTATLEACEDTDGDRFRSLWERDCEPVYINGVKVAGQLRCYRKIMFSVSDAAMESGQIFRASGFASGNFNYRNMSMAVNVVGTAARQCVDPALPSTCYSAGFIPFTLIHAGPYEVRSYDTTTFEANLYPAQIRNARALAAERYITNPISGADQSMISQYTRNEYNGRPLTGTYELRIYEEAGVNFHGIEDIQLVLGYEYWTRSQQLQ